MKIESLPINTPKHDPRNARRHTGRNLDAIKESLRRFGQQRPIVLDPQSVVLAGNGTLQAARQLGWKRIDCIRTRLTGAEAAAFALADNRTAELAEWDLSQLCETLQSIGENAEEPLLGTGFDDDDLQRLLRQTGLDQIAARPPAPTLYQVVVHCGSASEQEDAYHKINALGLKARPQTI